jgi:hypothetical protein
MAFYNGGETYGIKNREEVEENQDLIVGTTQTIAWKE